MLPPATPIVGPEHEEWVRKVWALHGDGGEPRTCDCGFFPDTHLVTCGEKQRVRCRAEAQDRLKAHHRHNREREVRGRRAFPGEPHARAGQGKCKWCGEVIVHGRIKQRTRHDGRLDEPNCLHEFFLRTNLNTQRDFLLDRDERRCGGCKERVGGWMQRVGAADPNIWRSWGPSYERRYPVDVWAGPFCPLHWSTPMEVDHIVALGLVSHLPDDERREYFAPGNLQLLCRPCHLGKTKTDTAAIRALQKALR